MSGIEKRRYIRLSAVDRLAAQLMYIGIDDSRISEECIANCFNVSRMTLRNWTIRQGLTRGRLEQQIDRLRQLYESIAGPVGSDEEWAGVVTRARGIAQGKLYELRERQTRCAA